MKKFVCLLFVMILLLSVSSVAFAASFNETVGVVTAVDLANAQIKVKLSSGSEILFNMDASTTLLSATTGKAVSPSEVAAGDSFRAWHASALTRSNPAQAYLHTMLLQKAGTYSYFQDFTVASVTPNASGLSLANTAGDLILSVPSSAYVRQMTNSGWSSLRASDIRPGAKLIVWYDVVMESYPAQAASENVLMLANGKAAGGVIDIPQTGEAQTATLSGLAVILCGAALALGVVGRRGRDAAGTR